jgi:hypothetical protein
VLRAYHLFPKVCPYSKALLAGWELSMPIDRLLHKNLPMEHDEISRLRTAYEQALRGIGLVDRDDPLSEMVAKKVIKIAKSGLRDPADIAALAILELGLK